MHVSDMLVSGMQCTSFVTAEVELDMYVFLWNEPEFIFDKNCWRDIESAENSRSPMFHAKNCKIRSFESFIFNENWVAIFFFHNVDIVEVSARKKKTYFLPKFIHSSVFLTFWYFFRWKFFLTCGQSGTKTKKWLGMYNTLKVGLSIRLFNSLLHKFGMYVSRFEIVWRHVRSKCRYLSYLSLHCCVFRDPWESCRHFCSYWHCENLIALAAIREMEILYMLSNVQIGWTMGTLSN